MGVKLLLIDTKSTVMQGFFSASRLSRYEPDLKANTIYKLKRFMLKFSNSFYKVTDHKQELSFTDQTTLVEVRETGAQIDQQWFRLRLANDFAAIVDRNGDLFDTIGKITLIQGNNLHSPTTMETAPEVSDAKSKDRVLLHLLMKDSETMRIYLWDKIAAVFRTRWNTVTTKQRC